MKYLFSVFFSFFLLVAPLMASAGVVTWKWINPTTYVDGTTLEPTEIIGTRVQYGTCGTSTPPTWGTTLGTATVQGQGTSVTINNLKTGDTYCARAFTLVDGAESNSSNIVLKPSVALKPKPAVMQ